jgi:hypothetical protein
VSEHSAPGELTDKAFQLLQWLAKRKSVMYWLLANVSSTVIDELQSAELIEPTIEDGPTRQASCYYLTYRGWLLTRCKEASCVRA